MGIGLAFNASHIDFKEVIDDKKRQFQLGLLSRCLIGSQLEQDL